jgi:hypothetical protein
MAGGTTEIPHLEKEDADLRPFCSWKSDIFGDGREAAPMVESLAPAPAPDDGRPSCKDADMTEVNEAAPQPGPLPIAVGGVYACATSNPMKEEAPFSSWKSAIGQELLMDAPSSSGFARSGAEGIARKVEERRCTEQRGVAAAGWGRGKPTEIGGGRRGVGRGGNIGGRGPRWRRRESVKTAAVEASIFFFMDG